MNRLDDQDIEHRFEQRVSLRAIDHLSCPLSPVERLTMSRHSPTGGEGQGERETQRIQKLPRYKHPCPAHRASSPLIRPVGPRWQLNMPTQRKPLPRFRGRRDSGVRRRARKKADRIVSNPMALFSGSEVSQALAQICGLVSQASHRLSHHLTAFSGQRLGSRISLRARSLSQQKVFATAVPNNGTTKVRGQDTLSLQVRKSCDIQFLAIDATIIARD